MPRAAAREAGAYSSTSGVPGPARGGVSPNTGCPPEVAGQSSRQGCSSAHWTASWTCRTAAACSSGWPGQASITSVAVKVRCFHEPTLGVSTDTFDNRFEDVENFSGPFSTIAPPARLDGWFRQAQPAVGTVPLSARPARWIRQAQPAVDRSTVEAAPRAGRGRRERRRNHGERRPHSPISKEPRPATCGFRQAQPAVVTEASTNQLGSPSQHGTPATAPRRKSLDRQPLPCEGGRTTAIREDTNGRGRQRGRQRGPQGEDA